MCALTVEAAPWSVSTVDVGPQATFRGLIWTSISIMLCRNKRGQNESRVTIRGGRGQNKSGWTLRRTGHVYVANVLCKSCKIVFPYSAGRQIISCIGTIPWRRQCKTKWMSEAGRSVGVSSDPGDSQSRSKLTRASANRGICDSVYIFLRLSPNPLQTQPW